MAERAGIEPATDDFYAAATSFEDQLEHQFRPLCNPFLIWS